MFTHYNSILNTLTQSERHSYIPY